MGERAAAGGSATDGVTSHVTLRLNVLSELSSAKTSSVKCSTRVLCAVPRVLCLYDRREVLTNSAADRAVCVRVRVLRLYTVFVFQVTRAARGQARSTRSALPYKAESCKAPGFL